MQRVVIFLIVASVSVDSIYFSLTDIKTTVPTVKGRMFSRNSPIITLNALGEKSTISFILKDPLKSLEISKGNGDVSFTKKFLQGNNYTDIPPIESSITVTDNTEDHDQTAIQIKFQNFITYFDCVFIINDLCFWESAGYRIYEQTPPSLIGPLASAYLAEICPGFEINYTIVKNNDFFLSHPHNKTWMLATKRRLQARKIHRSLNVTCTVVDPQKSSRSTNKLVSIEVMDIDDNPPIAQDEEINVPMSSNVVVKGQTVDNHHVIFQDKDISEVNKYEAKVLNDPLGVLQVNCTKHSNNFAGQPPTAIVCRFIFKKNEKIDLRTYSVILQLNDTSMVGKNEDKVVNVPVHFLFHNESGYHPATYKKPEKPLILYPTRTVKIFRTAAPYARVTQPPKDRLGNGVKNFTLTTTAINLQTLFAVTSTEGIIYVNDISHLSTAPEIVRLTITWQKDNKSPDSLSDLIEVMIVLESKQTCLYLAGKHPAEWEWCSNYQSKKDCVSGDACGIATGGASSVSKSSIGQEPRRCTWRGDKNPGGEITSHYATCTPDTDTCPDQICDSLESLHELICPQDCTNEPTFPHGTNPKTSRGIYQASGICTCGSNGNCACGLKPKKAKNRAAETTTASLNHTVLSLANVSRHTGNVTSTGSILGIGLSHCGTTCVLGIVAGVLFLTGTVAMIVICFHLDRVHKTIRSKFGDENQDLSAPLSDYIDRNTIPDPLPLNFNMTTSLADNTILDILNKYAPDPKWEFLRNQLIIEQTLGEGEFGRVLRAKALNIAGQTGYTTVAVKTLKDDARETELNDLLSEYQLLKEVSHPNVIRLLGVCTAPGGPIYLIIEFAEHGSLRNYLRRSRHLKSETFKLPSSRGLDDDEVHYDEPNVSKITPKEILSFAWQICKGMAYLSEIKLVHRDLAARNVLLAADKICKISDFGLTRDIYEDDAYFKRSKGRVPVKWMAPESLSDHVYTNKSDVWSFGILIWELVTLGATPYPGIAVQNLFHLLKQGYRMERPDNCSTTLYNIMRSCWHIEPEQRPTFQELSRLWEKMLSDEVEYLDLTNNAIHNRSYFCTNIEDKNYTTDEKSESNPLNYLSKSQSYVKCGAADKFHDDSLLDKESKQKLLEDTDQDTNQNKINKTQGYETPVKVAKKIQTPTNDCPQYYTDMAAGKTD